MKKIICSIFLIFLTLNTALAQNAAILPNAKTTFVDANGKPLSSGTIDFYVPNTTTRKTTWQDQAKTIPNSNPVILDAAGRALIWGDGFYRQVVKDRFNNLQWDQVTASAGSGSGTSSGDGLAVGTELSWPGIVAPSQYQFAYGQALSRTTFSTLFSNLTLSTSITCTGGSPVITNITDTSSLNLGAVLEANCVSGNPTIISKTSTSVTLTGNASVSLTTTGRFFPYGNGDGLTTFNVPDRRGYTLVGRCNMGGVNCSVITNPTYNDPNAVNGFGGSQIGNTTATISTTNLPASPLSVTGTGSGTTGSYSPQALSGVAGNPAVAPAGADAGVGGATGGGFNTYDSTKFRSIQINGFSSLAVSTSVTGTTSNLGSGTPLPIAYSNIQPSRTTNIIIKVTADTSSSVVITVPSGSTSVPLFSTGVPGDPPAYRAIVGSDLPNPTTISLGGVFSKNVSSGQVISGMDTSGNLTVATNGIFQTTDVFSLAVGRQGATNPAFQVDASQALQDTGLKVTGQAAANGVNIETVGTNATIPLIINAKGPGGTINFGTNSTGDQVFFRPSSHQGSTSGSARVSAQAVAGSPSLLWPNTSGTLVASASGPLSANATTGVVSCNQCVTVYAFQVDLNTVQDNAFTFNLPPGVTKFRVQAITVVNTSSTPSLNTAQVGVFTSTGGGGAAIVTGGTALAAITTNAVATNAATLALGQAISTAYFNTNPIYFRVTTGQGSSAGLATVTVNIQITPVN